MSPNDHLLTFQRKLRRTRKLLGRQVSLNGDSRVPISEVEAIYELCFLQVFISFENSIVELMKTNLMLPVGSDGKKRSMYPIVNRTLAGRILKGTSGYFSIMPVEQLQKVAKVYLRDGRPFTELSPAIKGEVSKAYAIRNHIAHRSPETQLKYQNQVVNLATLPRVSFIPGYYLRSYQTAQITYFDHHVSELGRALRFCCDNT